MPETATKVRLLLTCFALIVSSDVGSIDLCAADDCTSSMAGLSVEDEQFLAELTESMGEHDAQVRAKAAERSVLGMPELALWGV
jgi:hypothetical protein